MSHAFLNDVLNVSELGMDEESPKKLSDLFNDGWELFRDIEGSEEASNSEILQVQSDFCETRVIC